MKRSIPTPQFLEWRNVEGPKIYWSFGMVLCFVLHLGLVTFAFGFFIGHIAAIILSRMVAQ